MDLIAYKLAKKYASKIKNGYGYNLDNALFRYKAKLAASPSSIAKIACYGDSITEGYDSGDNDVLSWPVRLREAMQARYGGTDEGFVPVALTDRERWTMQGTGWVSGKYGIACMMWGSNTVGDTITFTFNGTHVDILHCDDLSGGLCPVTVDGVPSGNLDCTLAGSMVTGQLQTFGPFAPGDHTLIITVPSGGKNAYIEGAIVRNGDATGVRVDRRGANGSKASEWVEFHVKAAAFSRNPVDLYLIALGINDCGGGRTPAQLKTDLQSLITEAKPFGSIVLLPMFKPGYGGNYDNWDEDYVNIFYQLADENDIGVISLYDAFGKSFEPANSLGLFDSDKLHPTVIGHQLIADTVYRLIS